MVEIPNDSSAYLDIANKIFKRIDYQASDVEIKSLAKNISLLEKKGLYKLNRRLIDGGRKIWDTFSEHNFAAILISYHRDKTHISYEPDEGLHRPPDFKVVIGELTYWIQVKRLSNLEKENRQNTIVRKIETAAQKIDIGMFFGCDLSEHFSENDIPDLIDFIAEHAEQSVERKEYFFPNKNKKPKAKVYFWPSNKSKVSSLTLGNYGDMDMVEVTGLAKSQIKQSLINAARAFEWNVEQHTINLVAMDADHKRDIDLCDAVFGTEFEKSCGNKNTWSRGNDGFFNLPDFSKKVAGVIVTKRKEPKLISDCFLMLFVNDKFKDRYPGDLNNLLSFDKVIYYNMRPPMGKGNFDLT